MKSPNAQNGQIFPAQARLVATYSEEVNASTTLAGLGIILPDDTIGVEVRVEDATILRFGFKTAAAGNGGIAQFDSFEFWDVKSTLETLAFFTGEASKKVSFFIYTGE